MPKHWWSGGNLNRLNSFFSCVDETSAGIGRALRVYDSLLERTEAMKQAVHELCDAAADLHEAWEHAPPHPRGCTCEICAAVATLRRCYCALDSVFDRPKNMEMQDEQEA
jgi:hypothetical protein